eukprot:5021631-Amphidinium_carterae.1
MPPSLCRSAFHCTLLLATARARSCLMAAVDCSTRVLSAAMSFCAGMSSVRLALMDVASNRSRRHVRCSKTARPCRSDWARPLSRQSCLSASVSTARPCRRVSPFVN